MDLKSKKQLFWFVTASLAIYLILPSLFMDGMFVDGTQYTCVSKNLANAKGTFWFPFLSETWHKQGGEAFLEQPPLMYALQAPFFKLLGDSLYTERIYILITFLITSSLIIIIWRYIAPSDYKKHGWLPVLFWLSIPLTSWTFRHNMQENTMVIFTTLAIYFGIRSVFEKSRIILYAILTGCCIFLASFTKGLPGLFPLVLAIAAYLSLNCIKLKKAIYLTLIYTAVPAIIYILLILFNENAAESLTFYFKSRLLIRVDSSPVVDSRLYILWRLILELLPALAIAITFSFLSKKFLKPGKMLTTQRKKAAFFFIMGFAGSLPLMLTLVQRGFYMSISFPMFGLAFAFLSVSHVNAFFKSIRNRKRLNITYLLSITIAIVGLGITITLAGKPGRDKGILEDVYNFGEVLDPYHRISCDGPAYHTWAFQFYMLRYNDIYLEKSDRLLEYFVVKKGSIPNRSENYIKLDIETLKFDLYQKVAP